MVEEQKKKEKRKFSIMVFDDSHMGVVKSRRVSLKIINIIIALVAIYVITSVSAFYFLQNLFSERSEMLVFKKENDQLKSQIAGYASQLEEINRKMENVDVLEKKVKKLATYKTKPENVKKIAIGGKEINVMQDLSAISERKENEFFEILAHKLNSLGNDLDKNTVSLSALGKYLEQQNIVLNSTPSIWPVKGWISSSFGFRISPFTSKKVFHEGVDIAGRLASPVRATADGIVLFSGEKDNYGKTITIDHGFGYVTRYAHLSELNIVAGETVTKGQIIAKLGNTGKSTGPHLHYEVRIHSIPVNPMTFIVSEAKIQ